MYLGQLVAISVVQAGAVYPFLSNATFQYICGKRTSEIEFNVSDIPDASIRELVKQVTAMNLLKICNRIIKLCQSQCMN